MNREVASPRAYAHAMRLSGNRTPKPVPVPKDGGRAALEQRPMVRRRAAIIAAVVFAFLGFGLGSAAARNNLANSDVPDVDGLIELDMTQAQADVCEDAVFALSLYTGWISGALGASGTDFEQLSQLVVDEAARSDPERAERLGQSLENVITYCEFVTQEGREITLRGRVDE